MKNIFIVYVTAMITLFAVTMSNASIAKCKIEEVAGDKIIVRCEQKAGEFTKGQWVKMKTVKKSK